MSENLEQILEERANNLNKSGPFIELEAFSDDEFAGVDGKAVEKNSFHSLEKSEPIITEPFSVIGRVNDYIRDQDKPQFTNYEDIMETSVLLSTKPEHMNMVGSFEDNGEEISGVAPVSSNSFANFSLVTKPKTNMKCKICDWEGSKTTYYSKHKKACEEKTREEKEFEERFRTMKEFEENFTIKEANVCSLSNPFGTKVEEAKVEEAEEAEVVIVCKNTEEKESKENYSTLIKFNVTLSNGVNISIDKLIISGSSKLVITSEGIEFN